MFTIQQVTLSDKPLEKLAQYSDLLIPEAASLLKEPIDPSQFQFIAFEAVIDNKPVGFILAKLFSSNQSAQLFSLFVIENERKKTIGTALFQALQNHAKSLKARSMGFEYLSSNPYAQAIEKILVKNDWSKPLLYRIQCTFKVQEFHPPWFEKLSKVSRGLKIFPLKDLKAVERKLIKHQESQGTFPAYLSPFKNPETIDPINSQIVRYKHKLVGWIITHRIKKDTLKYTSLYIDRDLLGTGYGIQLLAEAIRRQQKSSVPFSLFEVNLDHVDSSWIYFIKRRLLPYAISVERYNWAFNLL